MKVRVSYEFDFTEALVKKLSPNSEAAPEIIDIIFNGGQWQGSGHWPYSKALADKKHALDIMVQVLMEDVVNGMGTMKHGEYTETIEEIK